MNFDRMIEFYECLSIQFKEERHGSGPLHFTANLDGIVFEIYPAKNRADVDQTTRLGFTVLDLRAAMNLLRTRGATIVSEISESPWGERAVVRDPDDRAVELYASETA